MTNQIAELTSSGSSRSCSGSEQKCHQTGACVPIVTAAGWRRHFSQLRSGASSSDLHRAGPVTPGGSSHLLLSGAALIELSNFTGRDWGLTGQGLSVVRAPCARSFSSGHLVLASRPSEEMVRPLCVGSWGCWGESPMAIEIFRTEAAHGHTDLPRFAVRSGSLGRIAPPHSCFHRNRELPCIARRRAAGMGSSVQRVAWEVAVVEVVSWWLEQGWGRSACDRAAARLAWSHSSLPRIRPRISAATDRDAVAFLVGHRSDRQWP